ncbi:OmpA family protein [candidate division CSSED10-310 bacterium]|uniref:OmpA family protein n=1 Tax=candidate division CSSED10-310 bacterium TaxID=2855610 RepID=A0ABV6YSJ9_UNCC1
MNKFFTLAVLLSFSLLVCCSGCATKKYVNQGFKNVDDNLESIENSVEANQTRINENERVIKDHEGKIISLSDETRAALSKIESVEKIAMGKLLYQVTLDNDAVKFELGAAQLQDEAMLVLDEVVGKLIQDNKNVFIEIQGHTDSSGEEEYNNQLGMKRAEAVRRYLSQKGIPLHRMSTISFGETKPVADNSTVEGRKQNRRVVMLILE